IGSRRRRAALEHASNIPFEQLPYQCFQEARRVLAEDRLDKVEKIEEQRKRISKLLEKIKTVETAQDPNGHTKLQGLKDSLFLSRKHLEWLKVQADINDPLVKRKFEDGFGDMSKPVYRHLADQKWRSYEHKIVMQRITQMNVIPDVLPTIDPIVQLNISFKGKRVQHGERLNTDKTEHAPTLRMQAFDQGERLVTIAVVDSDVPNVEEDDFDHRCHALFTNVRVSPTSGVVDLGEVAQESTVMPWYPPHAQKGSPWHRLSVWILQQPEDVTIDKNALSEKYTRNTFTMRRLVSQFPLKPIGVTMFRTSWDETTKDVMERNGIEGADIEFKKAPITPMRYKKKDGARYR
ncbi:PEBP-like protein, partial [Rhizodiscina lignyota]